jgi:hypothetical protein
MLDRLFGDERIKVFNRVFTKNVGNISNLLILNYKLKGIS